MVAIKDHVRAVWTITSVIIMALFIGEVYAFLWQYHLLHRPMVDRAISCELKPMRQERSPQRQ